MKNIKIFAVIICVFPVLGMEDLKKSKERTDRCEKVFLLINRQAQLLEKQREVLFQQKKTIEKRKMLVQEQKAFLKRSKHQQKNNEKRAVMPRE